MPSASTSSPKLYSNSASSLHDELLQNLFVLHVQFSQPSTTSPQLSKVVFIQSACPSPLYPVPAYSEFSISVLQTRNPEPQNSEHRTNLYLFQKLTLSKTYPNLPLQIFTLHRLKLPILTCRYKTADTNLPIKTCRY